MRKIAILFLIMVLCLSASRAQADLTLNDGLTHDIASTVSQSIRVYDNPIPPPKQTTVNFQTGGLIGSSWGLYTYDSSLANIYGGAIEGDLATMSSSHADIYGGSIGLGILSWDSSSLNIYGGSIAGWLRTDGVSTVNIYGGSMPGVLSAFYNSTINIYGVGFNYSYGPISVTTGNLTGTLYMGDSLSMDFSREHDGASIILHEMAVVPAPGALLLGSIGIGIAGGIVGWMKRRSTI